MHSVCMCVNLLANATLEKPAGRGPMGWVRWDGLQAGLPAGQRGCASSVCVCHKCVLVSLEGCVHACTMELFVPAWDWDVHDVV